MGEPARWGQRALCEETYGFHATSTARMHRNATIVTSGLPDYAIIHGYDDCAGWNLFVSRGRDQQLRIALVFCRNECGCSTPIIDAADMARLAAASAARFLRPDATDATLSGARSPAPILPATTSGALVRCRVSIGLDASCPGSPADATANDPLASPIVATESSPLDSWESVGASPRLFRAGAPLGADTEFPSA